MVKVDTSSVQTGHAASTLALSSSFVVADVVNDHALWNLAVCTNPHGSVCLCVLPVKKLLAVALFIFALVPDYAFTHGHSLSPTDSV